MSKPSEIVQRLRMTRPVGNFRDAEGNTIYQQVPINRDGAVAADLIEALTKERDARNELLKEFLAFAMSGAGFSYPLGSLQKLRAFVQPEQKA